MAISGGGTTSKPSPPSATPSGNASKPHPSSPPTRSGLLRGMMRKPEALHHSLNIAKINRAYRRVTPMAANGRMVGATAGNGRTQVAQADDTPPPLRRLHSDETYATDRVAKDSLEYLRKQPTDALVESLKPSSREPLVTKPDGTIMQGNTRVKILEERGYDVNSLPRTPYTTFRSGGGGMSGGSGGMRGPGDIGGLKPSPLVRPRRSDFLN